MATKTPYELEQERLRQQQQAQAVNQQQPAPAPVVPGAPAPTPMLANFQNAPQGQYQMAPDVQNAYQIYQGMLGAKPGAYQSQYQPQMDALFQQFQNRKPFEYDMNADVLYQQMKDQYARNAKMSMQDTMGQAASMTGGYGSSYGQIAGQQAYDQQMTQLHNNIPALSDRKYAQYQDEGNQLLSQFGMAGQLEGQQYGQYRDSKSDWFNETQMAGNRYDTERGFDYGQQMDAIQQNFQNAQFEFQKATDARDYQAAEYWKNQQMEYQKEMDALSQQNWQSEFGFQQEQFQYGKDMDAQARADALAAGSGGSGGSSAGSTGSAASKAPDTFTMAHISTSENVFRQEGADGLKNYIQRLVASGAMSPSAGARLYSRTIASAKSLNPTAISPSANIPGLTQPIKPR